MKSYLLLMRGGDEEMAKLSEDESQAHMAKWGVFMGDLKEKGHLTGGMPLNRDGRLITNSGVTDQMVLSDKGEYIGGYLMLDASSYDEAVKLGGECPIFEVGGSVEVREIMNMDNM